jgi:glycosyltransferase involved in cell wall biosynthesis
MERFSHTAIIIPAFRPNENLIKLIHTLKLTFHQPIIVVDDGNPNQKIFKQLSGVTVLHHPINQGKGAALKTAFQYVLGHLPEIDGVVTADADGQHPSEDILKVAMLLDQDSRAFYLATRTFNKRTPLTNTLGNLITRYVFLAVTGQKVMDTQNGLRGIPRWLLSNLIKIPQQRFDYEMAMLKEIAVKKTTIIQVPTQTIYHQEGAISSFRQWRDSYLIYQILLKDFFRFLIVSILSFVIDYSLFLLFYQWLTGTYRIILAVIFSRILSGIANYTLNRLYSFRSKVKLSQSMVQYLLLFLIIMASSAWLTDGITLLGVSAAWSKLMVDIFLFIVSYQVQKKYIFKHES